MGRGLKAPPRVIHTLLLGVPEIHHEAPGQIHNAVRARALKLDYRPRGHRALHRAVGTRPVQGQNCGLGPQLSRALLIPVSLFRRR